MSERRDDYERQGEFHDLFMDDAWEGLRPSLSEAYSTLSEDAVVVDVGAGTGMGTRVLAEVTRAQLVAIEPSVTMRAVLLARVADVPELRHRVSVHAGFAPTVFDELQSPVAGFVCAHMLGHLGSSERVALFGRLAESLAPDGVGVITLPGAPESRASAEPVVEERRIGRHRYLARHHPTDQAGVARSEYLVMDGDRVLRTEAFDSDWVSPTRAELTAELGLARLRLEPLETNPAVGYVRAEVPA